MDSCALLWDEQDVIEMSNRDKKIDARKKKKNSVPASRAYLHAMTNSLAKRYKNLTKGKT